MYFKNFKNILTVAAAALIMYSCEYETHPTYHGEDQVFFWWAADRNRSNYRDILFGYDRTPKDDSTILIPVTAMGTVAEYDRPVSFKYVTVTTAVEGRDFVLLPEISVVRAGATTGVIAIKLFNTDLLVDSTLRIMLELVENEHFKADYIRGEFFSDSWSSLSTMRATRYGVYFDSKSDRPNLWTPAGQQETLDYWFGTYSRAKFDLMCEELPGCSWEMFTYNPLPIPYEIFTDRFPVAVLSGWGRALHFILEERKRENDGIPLYDENGMEIRSGSSFSGL